MNKSTALSIEKKIVVNIKDGNIVGNCSKCLIDQNSHRLIGLMIDGQAKCFVREDMLRSFDADVVITDGVTDEAIENVINPIGAMLLTNDGVFIGTVLDVSFFADGVLQEVLVSGGNANDKRLKPSVVEASKISKFGKDAIFCEPLNESDYLEPDRELYDISHLGSSNAKRGSRDDQKFEERFEQMTNKITKSVNDLGHMVSGRLKNIDKEAVSTELSKFAEIVNKEVSQVIDNVADNFSSMKKEINEKDIKAVLNDLAGNTVSKPVNDKNGQIIIMPGQTINEDKVISAIRAEKVAELYRVAIPMEEEGGQSDVEQD